MKASERKTGLEKRKDRSPILLDSFLAIQFFRGNSRLPDILAPNLPRTSICPTGGGVSLIFRIPRYISSDVSRRKNTA